MKIGSIALVVVLMSVVGCGKEPVAAPEPSASGQAVAAAVSTPEKSAPSPAAMQDVLAQIRNDTIRRKVAGIIESGTDDERRCLIEGDQCNFIDPVDVSGSPMSPDMGFTERRDRSCDAVTTCEGETTPGCRTKTRLICTTTCCPSKPGSAC